MVTIFEFGETVNLGGSVVYSCVDFPVDLKIGDVIFIYDFSHLLQKGYYTDEVDTSKDFLTQKEIDNCPSESIVKKLFYGMAQGKVVKGLYLEEV